jgi:transcriptional/translational regulatory protein YebC/TACO1
MSLPKNRIEIGEPKVARRILDLIDALEEHDDVQAVAANQEIPDSVAAAAKAEAV